MTEPAASSVSSVARPLFFATGICKNFGPTTALAGADFEVNAGEVHALVGANGAGKSTLSRIISGHLLPDRGEMRWTAASCATPARATRSRSGISMVTQETSLAPDLSVLENIMLPRLAMPGRLSWTALRRQARQLVDELGQEAGLALDALFGIMRSLAARDHGLIFVSHRLEEIFAVTDRITVLREGRVVAQSAPTEGMAPGELVRLMVGRELSDVYARAGAATSGGRTVGKTMLRVAHLAFPPRVRDVSFEVRAGEILGLGGLVGAGRSETVETIFGLHRPVAGTVELDGKPFRPRSPHDAIRGGLGFIAEDRRRQGIVPDFSVRENLLLAHLGDHRGIGLGYDSRTPEVRRMLELLELPERRLLDANMLTFPAACSRR